jgi:hypothetical protein
MPALGIASQSFELQRQQLSAPERGGRFVSVDIGQPLWSAEYATPALTEAQFSEWRAWLSSLRGSSRMFNGRDRSRRYPLLYPSGFGSLTRAGGGAFDGTATSWSVDVTRAILTFNGLPASFSISAGDYVGFAWSSNTKRALVRAQENVNANGSGVASFEVEPFVSQVVPGGAVATLDQPSCLMRLLGDSDASYNVSNFGRVSFKAIQHLEA